MKVELNIRTVAIAGISIIALSLAYYFVIALPQQGEAARIFAARQECREAGEKIYEEDVKNDNSYLKERPVYGFNAKLNTCLYARGWTGSHHRDSDGAFIYSSYHYVKNSLSGETIISSYLREVEGEEPQLDDLTLEEFEKQKEELFN